MRLRIAALVVIALAGCGRRELRAVIDASVAEPDARNACGGAGLLEAFPGTACGTCGIWECDGPEDVVCGGDVVDACGRCGTPPDEWCNGRDDDCDGVVDERCLLLLDGLASTAWVARIDGDRIAAVARNPETKSQVWLHDLRSGESGYVASGDGQPERHDAGMELDGTRLVWSRAAETPHGSIRDYDVFVADLEGGAAPTRIDGDHPVHDAWVDIDGDRVAFVAAEQIVVRDLRDERETQHPLPGWPLDLGGDWVIAGDGRWGTHPGRTVTLVDLRDGSVRPLTVPPDRVARDLATDGEVAVYVTTALDGTAPRLVVIDLATMAERTLPLDAPLTDLDVRGGLVCGSAGGAVVLDLASARSMTIGEHATGCDLGERAVIFIDEWWGEPRLRYLQSDEP